MDLSLRQWLVILVLIVGFVVAAIIARGDGTTEADFDQAAWCAGAQGLAGLEPLFYGTVSSASEADYDAAKEALYAVETSAPPDLWSSISVLSNFAFIATQQFDGEAWPAPFAAARDNVDADDVDAAIPELRAALLECGVTFAG